MRMCTRTCARTQEGTCARTQAPHVTACTNPRPHRDTLTFAFFASFGTCCSAPTVQQRSRRGPQDSRGGRRLLYPAGHAVSQPPEDGFHRQRKAQVPTSLADHADLLHWPHPERPKPEVGPFANYLLPVEPDLLGGDMLRCVVRKVSAAQVEAVCQLSMY